MPAGFRTNLMVSWFWNTEMLFSQSCQGHVGVEAQSASGGCHERSPQPLWTILARESEFRLHWIRSYSRFLGFPTNCVTVHDSAWLSKSVFVWSIATASHTKWLSDTQRMMRAPFFRELHEVSWVHPNEPFYESIVYLAHQEPINL